MSTQCQSSLPVHTLSLYLMAMMSPFVRQAKDLKAFSNLYAVRDHVSIANEFQYSNTTQKL